MGWEKEPPQQRIGKMFMQASWRQSGIGQLGTEEAMPSHGQGLPAWVLCSASQFAASGLQQGCSLWGGSAPCIIEIGQVKSRIKIIVYLLSCPLGSFILKGTHRQLLCPQQGEDLCTRKGGTAGGAGNPTMNRRAGQRARFVKGMVAAPLEKSWGKG